MEIHVLVLTIYNVGTVDAYNWCHDLVNRNLLCILHLPGRYIEDNLFSAIQC